MGEATEQVKEQATQAAAEVSLIKPGDEALAMGFGSGASFALLQRAATVLSKSTLVPTIYQNNLPNCIIALNMAARLGADPLMVMQNLYVVQGKPGWSAQFLIATINQCGRFTALRYEWKGEANSPEWGCRAWAIEKSTGERLNGSWVTWGIVAGEGWNAKNGSKWKTMPEQMFMYRAGTFFVRAYAPELAMGLQTAEEMHDSGNGGEKVIYGSRLEEVLDDPDGERPHDVGSGGLADRLKAQRTNGEDKDTEPAPAAASTPEQPAQREPGDESEQELSAAEVKKSRDRIEVLLVHPKLVGKAFDILERAAGPGIRKVNKIPSDKLYAVESALTDATAE